MAVIGEWEIGGFKPQHVISPDFDSYPTITLNCLAKPWQLDDARWEIHQIMKMACGSINRKPLLNGGECLVMPPGSNLVTITDGFYEWKGAVHYPKFKEDGAAKPGLNQRIEWNIVLEVMDETRELVQTEPEEP